MEKKKFYIVSCALLSTCAIVGILGGVFGNNFKAIAFDNTDNRLIFDRYTNKLTEDYCTTVCDIKTASVTTNNGGIVNMEYTGMYGRDDCWSYLYHGSYFRNTTAIRGITSIKVKFFTDKCNYRIYYSDTNNISTSSPYISKQTTNSVETITFESKPYYFMLYFPYNNTVTSTTEGLRIDSFEIDYDCSSDYVELETSCAENKGEVIGSKGIVKRNSTISLIANPVQGYQFDHWTKDGKVLTEETHSYLTATISDNAKYVAHFVKRLDTEWDKTHGVNPIVSEDEKEVTYGLWPTTRITDETLIDNFKTYHIPDDVFFNWDNEYYVASTCRIYNDEFQCKTFNDKVTAVNDEIYFFKCEPMVWNVVTKTEGEEVDTYDLETKDIIDARDYSLTYDAAVTREKTDYKGDKGVARSNNYKFSEMRTYLNTSLYDKMFNQTNDVLKTVYVDNSASTTSSDSNPYACNSTFDKVYLQSHKFLNDRTKEQNRKYVSDYTLTQGSYKDARGLETADLNKGYYWSRSPSYIYSQNFDGVKYDGTVSLGGGYVTSTISGVVPSIQIEVAKTK